MQGVYKCKYLTGLKLKVFLAVANRIVPQDGDTPGAGTMTTAAIVDWAMDRLEPSLRRQLLLLFTAVEPLGILFGGRRFTKNSAAAQDRQLAWMESNPIRPLRLGFFGLKTYVCMGYYTREDIWKTIGYEGPVRPDTPFPDETIRQLAQGRLEVVE
jgi:hypothetical protein